MSQDVSQNRSRRPPGSLRGPPLASRSSENRSWQPRGAPGDTSRAKPSVFPRPQAPAFTNPAKRNANA